MSTRETMLAAIRKARGPQPDRAAAYADIDRTYQSTASMPHAAVLNLFVERLEDYEAHVFRVLPSEIAAAVQQRIAARNLTRILAPRDLDAAFVADSNVIRDREFTAQELDHFQGVITTATLGIAETGSIVLQNALGQGRRALTLVPDYHLCIVHASQVVETVVEAMRLLEPTQYLPTTFFSGPSATADIEMTRIKGVHGPRFVDVLLVN